MPGGQSRGLVQSALTKGWDPRRIPARAGHPEFDLSKWDTDPTSDTSINRYRGSFPGGAPPSAFPSDHPIPGGPHDIFGAVPFSTPDTSRETTSRGVREKLPVREPADLWRRR